MPRTRYFSELRYRVARAISRKYEIRNRNQAFPELAISRIYSTQPQSLVFAFSIFNSELQVKMESYDFLLTKLNTFWEKDDVTIVELGAMKDHISRFLAWVIQTDWGEL